MKKISLLFAVIAVCALAYHYMEPEEIQYRGESESHAFLNVEPEGNQFINENEVLAYLSLGLEGNQYLDESDVQAYTKTDAKKNRKFLNKKKKRYYAVKHNKPRASTLGFSITPPPGSDWYEKLEGNSLYYVKINELHKRYVILTEAREVRLRKKIKNLMEIQKYVKSEREKYLDSSGFKKPNLTVQIEEVPSEKCVRYSQHYQDHGMKGLQGRSFVNVDTQGVFCLHPNNEKIAVDVSYVEKSLSSNTQVTSFSNEGEKFLASLKFL